MSRAADYDDLRRQALGVRPADLGLRPGGGAPRVYGVVMETGYPEGVASLVVFANGEASLYLSSGGGIIGGGAHETVRRAAVQQIAEAQRGLGELAPTDAFPRPAVGRVRFYVLTTGGMLTAEAAEEDLGEERLALSPLFHAGHAVITELRAVAP
jgi:hypothetical protein